MDSMKMTTRWFSVLLSLALSILFGSIAHAQTHPHLFRQRPATIAPGAHGVAAHAGDIDEALLTGGPDSLTIAIPGRPDLRAERHGVERRGARNMVWRGRLQEDQKSKVTLTFHEGFLFGHIQNGNELFIIRPSQNRRTVVERIDPHSFAPEWGHDAATHGHERVPPATAGEPQQGGSPTAPAITAADGTIQIVLMSVYTPQARAGAGGTPQVQAQIQAAVDQANTAFMNSNMIPRFFLAHTAEVAYNDSGNIETDLNWVTSNSTVASLRNTYSADMVSLITNNGGGYCGIG